MTSLAPILQAFLTDHLTAQRRVSPHTVAAYRDTFKLSGRWSPRSWRSGRARSLMSSAPSKFTGSLCPSCR